MLAPLIDATVRPVDRDAPNASKARGSVLLVDDDPALLRVYTRILQAHGFRVEAVSSGAMALTAIERSMFDVVVSDISMPDMDGMTFLAVVRRYDLDVPVVLMTGAPTLETALSAIEHGALRYLQKPVETRELERVLDAAIRLSQVARAKRQALALLGGVDKLLGDQAGLTASFDRALDSMWMAYQPIVSWKSKSVFGYEALLRSTEALLPHPGAVLDAAERLNRLHDVGRRVRGRVGAASELPESALVFVNLHTQDLEDETLYDPEAPLTKLASRVILEITERASLDKVKDVQSRVARLRELGFRIAIDDLGAGYAGLTSFALLDPEVVKLDMSLVRDVNSSPTKRTLVRTLTQMCNDLGMLVVAEGVETPEERGTLLELGCDLMQGYLFARPERLFEKPRF